MVSPRHGSNAATVRIPARGVRIPIGAVELEGDWTQPRDASGAIIFAHGSGSSRHSPRNRFVAEVLHASGLATLLFDLLTPSEEEAERFTRHLRFDIGLLADRLTHAIDWLESQREARGLPVGLFGASTGAAAALVTAVRRPDSVYAVVSRGGRPDLAGEALPRVAAPTLLIVGGNDREVIELNRKAAARMTAAGKRLEIVPGASHLFEEPGTLERVADLASAWFVERLPVRLARAADQHDVAQVNRPAE